MLQEEFDHPITSALALYSCYGYLKKPQPEPWDPQPRAKPEEPTEEVKVRVDYIREPFFDDHFDLTDPRHLIGKTLIGFGKHWARQSPDALTHTSILVGWTLFEKFDKVIQSLDSLFGSVSKPVLFREGLELCKKSLQESTNLPDTFLDEFNLRVNRLEAEGFLLDGSLIDILKQRIKDAVKKHEKDDIQHQIDLYKKWEQLREDEVERQTEAAERRKRLEILEAKKKELAEKEERLNFFENLDEWELRSEEKLLQREMRAKAQEGRGRKISAKLLRQAEEDAYYPPEITSNRKK